MWKKRESEFEDVLHDNLDESDWLCDGVLDLKLKEGANRVQRVNFHEMPECMTALNEGDAIHGELKWLFYEQEYT